jgi:hypothetical protein
MLSLHSCQYRSMICDNVNFTGLRLIPNRSVINRELTLMLRIKNIS